MNLDILKQILPESAVSTDAAQLQSYKVSDPLAEGCVLPTAIVKPKDFDEVQKVVQAANKEGIKIVPVSSGAPHIKEGIGCREEHIVMDLSGWKEISGMSRRNLVCMIEPGVTYEELLPAIDKEGMQIPMPIAPRSGKSVLAASLDREPCTWPNKEWNAQDPICSLEFAFGSGEKFRTGSAAAPGTIEEQRALGISHKGPNGPGATGFQRLIMGSQGSMGVVTWATIKLEVKPAITKTYLVESDNLQAMEQFIYDVNHPRWGERQFMMNNVALAMLLTYKKPSELEAVRNKFKDYVCFQEIAGFSVLPEEKLRYQDRGITNIAVGHGLAMQQEIGGIAADEVLTAAVTPCGEQDWRKAFKGECLSLLMQTTLDRAGEYIATVKTVAGMEGIDANELGIYVQPMVQNSSVGIEFMLPYDKKDLQQIKSFEEKATQALNAQHAFFGRPYGTSAKIVWDNDPVSTKLLKTMKQLMDPNRVLNPGKFGL
ncbi:FAD-binding oxidoreductase [Christensenellaceae bacterium OttesenSCG-928-K19]|nr:FAD-binding oxidoreductase [Christensenellaceae bacterium OttesenSCG-928-K19]